MIEVVESPEWDEVEDRILLAQFLNSRTGQRLLPKVVEFTPGLLAEGDINKILIRTGEVRGWQKAIQTLLSLAVAPPEAPTKNDFNPSYPSLADDKAWNDGQNANPDKTP